MTLKTPARKSSRKRTHRDYANLAAGLGSDPNRWQRMVAAKDISPAPFRRMQGAELDSWLDDDENALREPVIIEQPDGLGMKMPPRDLTVEHVAEYIGEDTPLEVIGAPLPQPVWPISVRQRSHLLLLCRCRIAGRCAWLESGEVGGLHRARPVQAGEGAECHLARDLGHRAGQHGAPAENSAGLGLGGKFLAKHEEGQEQCIPQGAAVLSHGRSQCMDGTCSLLVVPFIAHAQQDWHIDFAGSSVYYHILHGSKVRRHTWDGWNTIHRAIGILLYPADSGQSSRIREVVGQRATEPGMAGGHGGRGVQSGTGGGEYYDYPYWMDPRCGECYWVYEKTSADGMQFTPVDTLVFGGNFLHSYDVATRTCIVTLRREVLK